MNLFNVLTLVDILRFSIVAIGVIYTALELRDVYEDRRILVRSGRNGPRQLLADEGIRNEKLRLVIQVLFMGTALTSVFWPADHNHPYPVRLIIDRLMLIGASLALTAKSWYSRNARHALHQYEIRTINRRITDKTAGQ